MPKYVIERAINGIGGASQDELTAIAKKSCAVLRDPRSGGAVGSELRHRRQDLLRLHRPERGSRRGTCAPGRSSPRNRSTPWSP